MLAITTTQQLTIVDQSLKRGPPSSLPSCLSLLAPCTASSWSPDNLYLFLSSTNTIHQYNPALNALTDIYSSPEPIAHLVCKSKSSLVFATADKVHVLESTKVAHTFDSHKVPITSLAILNDLLASTSAGAAHVHNLLLGSHTVLRGLNLSGQRITTCAFHPHSRTRLLLGVGKQLLVYDTTRPSGPLKTIPMNDTTTGDIVSIACSPFSKTLVAVANASGNVGLVDLDKEKALFRTISLKVPLTSIAFSPEGASIYLGTEHGKLLIMDLRALDKPPKTVIISDTGCRVETMAVQKKIKGNTDSSVKPEAAAKVSGSGEENNPVRRASATVAPGGAPARTIPKVAPSPSKGRIARIGSGTSPVRRPTTSTAPKSGLSPRPSSNANPKIFSPVRDPQGSASMDDISIQSTGKRGVEKKNKAAMPEDLKDAGLLAPAKDADSAPAGPRLSATSRTRKTSSTESASTRFEARARTASSTTRTESTKSARPRSASSASRPGSSASQRSSIPAVPPLPANLAARSAMPESRTPSPDLPSVSGDPATPLPVGKRGLPLGTPEAISRPKGNGKGKGKTVVFLDGNEENVPEDNEKERERERSLSMQISPRRPSSSGLGNSASWAPSPLRNTIPTSPGSGSSSAHDLLRTIVRDVMFDFQQEQRSEMVGLHLDLLRMGRGWKKELHDLMDEYVGDLRELRDENKRLREENELLRRGY
ncbi:WD40-repeat-containing domain protein [Mycena maculata]|uniref:WD40-repeat-containing domain protein n=1 Tax=Mycena maculata TaxID=230809 RepID=A0AAD7N1V1_9AGAR|nr:WD40-repeat-containing domain protein [Mycena maculata]